MKGSGPFQSKGIPFEPNKKLVLDLDRNTVKLSTDVDQRQVRVRSTPDGCDSETPDTPTSTAAFRLTKSHSSNPFQESESPSPPPPPSHFFPGERGTPLPTRHRTMSDTHSVTSTSSAPIFSAYDHNVEPLLLDPDFPSMEPASQLGSLPYSGAARSPHDNQIGADGIVPSDSSRPVSLDFVNSSPSLLYSFTDSSDDPSEGRSVAVASAATGGNPQAGIVDSFGLSPLKLIHPRPPKPRQLRTHATPPPAPPTGTRGSGSGSSVTDVGVARENGSSPATPNARGVPKFSTPLPDMGSESKEATPTPEAVRDAQTPTPDSHNGGREGAELLNGDDPLPSPHRHHYHQDLVQLHAPVPPPLSAKSASSVDGDPEQIPVLDSDMETASVVSVQQLTETYLNELPDPLPDGVTTPLSAGEGGRIPFLAAVPGQVTTPSSLRGPPPPSPGHASTQPHPTSHSPLVQKKHFGELPSPARMPAHINPSAKPRKRNSPLFPTTTTTHNGCDEDLRPPRVFEPHNTVSSTMSPVQHLQGGTTHPDGPGALEERLAEEQRARVYLQGQLEAVREECEAALKERPDLLAKLSSVEAQLAETASALERERNKSKLPSDPSSSSSEEAARALKDAGEALDQERQATTGLRRQLQEQEQKFHRLERDLEGAEQQLGEHESDLAELRDKLHKCQAEASKRAEELEETACKLSSLEAGYGALETNKAWLHSQLQDAQEAKLKLQEELRESKAAGIAHQISCDQLSRENSALQDKIGGLLRGVLQDKAQMVDQLKSIEADVVSREDQQADLIAERARLEDDVKRKTDALSRLNSELARARVEREELQRSAEEAQSEMAGLALRADTLQRENKKLADKLASSLRDLAEKSSDLEEVERVKGSLQSKLRQTDAEAAGREGTLRGLDEANKLLRRELDLVGGAKEAVERELAESKSELAMREAELKSALDERKEKEAELRAALESRQSAEEERRALRGLLAEKEREVELKGQAIAALESQTQELLGEFGTLRDNFQTMASGSATGIGSEMEEKDRVISHLALEKDRLEEELGEASRGGQDLQKKLGELQHERARLLGKVEGSVDQEDYKKALQDKAGLQDQLDTLKLEQKREDIKARSKLGQLEGELRAAQKSAAKAQTELESLREERNREANKMGETRCRAEAELQEAEEKLQRAVAEKERMEGLLEESARPSKQQELLRSQCEQLGRQNQELTEQLQQATRQKAEVERASSLVASSLKQNAEREKRELAERNRDLSLELERLRGRLDGMHTTQLTIRDHAASLELALAKKESSIVRLSAEAQKALEEKLAEEKAFETQVAALETQLKDSAAEVARERESVSRERSKVEELERRLKQVESEKDSRPSSSPSSRDKLAAVVLEKEALQSEVSYLKSQLLIAQTSAKSARRQAVDRSSQLEILERELEIARSQGRQAEEEARKLRKHLSSTGSGGSRELSRGPGGSGLLEASLSSVSGGDDEVDQPVSGKPHPIISVPSAHNYH